MEFFILRCTLRTNELNKHYFNDTIQKYQSVLIEHNLMLLDQTSGPNRYFLTQSGIDCLQLFNVAYQKKYDQIKFKKFLHPVK